MDVPGMSSYAGGSLNQARCQRAITVFLFHFFYLMRLLLMRSHHYQKSLFTLEEGTMKKEKKKI
jgi:hypothetical protein